MQYLGADYNWVSNLASVAVGGAISICSVVVIEIWREVRQAKNLRAAFAAELRAVLNSVDHNQFFRRLEDLISEIRRTSQPRFSTSRIASEMHNLVFRKNAHKIGLLDGELARNLAIVHYEINGTVFDLNLLADVADGGGGAAGAAARTDWRRCLEMYERLLRRSLETSSLATDLINDLEGKR